MEKHNELNNELRIDDEPKPRSPMLPPPEILTVEPTDTEQLETLRAQIQKVSEPTEPEHLPIPQLSEKEFSAFAKMAKPKRWGPLGWLDARAEKKKQEEERAAAKKFERERREFEKFKLEALDYIWKMGEKKEMTLEQQLTSLSGIGNDYEIAQKIRQKVRDMPKTLGSTAERNVYISLLTGLAGVDDDPAWEHRKSVLAFLEKTQDLEDDLASALAKSLACLDSNQAEDFRQKLRKIVAREEDILLSYVGVETKEAWKERDDNAFTPAKPIYTNTLISTAGLNSSRASEMREGIWETYSTSINDNRILASLYFAFNSTNVRSDAKIKKEISKKIDPTDRTPWDNQPDFLELMSESGETFSLKDKMYRLEKAEIKHNVHLSVADRVQMLFGNNITSAWWINKYKGSKPLPDEEPLPVEDKSPAVDTVSEKGLEGTVDQQIKSAERILGENVHGPWDLGIDFNREDLPNIPFHEADLERAKLYGQKLIYFTSTGNEGKPLTVENMTEKFESNLQAKGIHEVVMGFNRYKGTREPALAQDTPREGWALIDTEAPKETFGPDLIEQIEALIERLTYKIYEERDLPKEYAGAIDTFDHKKRAIKKLLESSDFEDQNKGMEMLEDLKVVQMLLPWPVEALYSAIALEEKEGAMLPFETLTARRWKSGNFVTVEGIHDDQKLAATLGTTYSRKGKFGAAMMRRR